MKVVTVVSIIILVLICISLILNSNSCYEVVTFDNELIKVNGYELYSSDMFIKQDNEKILIKSYKECE